MNNILGTKMYNSIFEIPIDGEKISPRKNINKNINKKDCDYLVHEDSDINTSKDSISNNDFYNIELFSDDNQNFILYNKENDNTLNLNKDEQNKKEIPKAIIYSNDIHSLGYQYANSSKVYMTEFLKPGWKLKAKKSIIKFKKLMCKIVSKSDIIKNINRKK